jgi:DNA modification methylase
MTYQILKGNSLDLLPTLADNSIDAIVTDPPYGLGNPDPDYIIKAIQQWASGDRSHIPEGKGFMGKSWDSFVPPPAIWDECLRVLKPGGHLLAFAGTRTYDLMGISIRMAGFEIRDSIGWVYGSGFPKSLDVSKAIDKVNGEGQRVQSFVRYMKTTQLKAKDIDEALKQAGLISLTSNRAIHYFNEGQPQIPTWEMWQVIRPMLGEVPFEIDLLVDRIEAEREVIGSKMSGIANKDEKERHTIGASKAIEVDITAPSTPEAQQWQGWGTALKPALEPIVVARKPLIGTVAENVLTHGTGGLNIDASRIGTEQTQTRIAGGKGFGSSFRDDGWIPPQENETRTNPLGRWPANLILDEYTAELLDEQSGTIKGMVGRKKEKGFRFNVAEGGEQQGFSGGITDTGGASRFFYVAKASKRDRNEGLEDLEAQRHSDRELDDGAGGDNPRNRTNQAKQNFHPTVKPTALMQYLVKLVTPPGGTVLDPFTGSGSTGKAAILEGFDFIGIELTDDYWPIIEGRLKHAEAKVAEAKENQEAQPQGLF